MKSTTPTRSVQGEPKKQGSLWMSAHSWYRAFSKFKLHQWFTGQSSAVYGSLAMLQHCKPQRSHAIYITYYDNYQQGVLTEKLPRLYHTITVIAHEHDTSTYEILQASHKSSYRPKVEQQ